MTEDLDNQVIKERVLSITDRIIDSVLNQATAREIVDLIISNLPMGLTDSQQSIIEITAEKLYTAEVKKLLSYII